MFEAKLGPNGDPGLSRSYRASPDRRPRSRSSPAPGQRLAAQQHRLDRTTTYPKMLQSLAEWVRAAAAHREILQDTPA